MKRSALFVSFFIVALTGCVQQVSPLPPIQAEQSDPQPIFNDPSIDIGDAKIIDRSYWSHSGPVLDKMNPMTRIYRITVHHEARTLHDESWAKSVRRIRGIQQAHFNNGWGDIGYHFIIDYKGRIWQARSLAYQGAHAKYNNEGNIGICLLGNFEEQYVSTGQKKALSSLLNYLTKRYSVSKRHIYTHRELKATACPGRYLQAYVEQFRR